ncbi:MULTISPECIES: CaiB/BaiF CoA-transferase family protein [unclassified Variovorax]|uniref:CaiB/BaiF CoA transferase family protein n=1 Tax=unclassified Variovorax TaxID=663243 RepID=UPI001BD36D3B|nr:MULTISPECIES: CoA transferase [unclassified Variovorax]
MQETADQRPLAGVRVVEFGQFIAGPGATQILADLGADVIKIESPNGDNGRRFGVSEATKGRSGLFMAYNRGKRSIVVDMRQAEGLAIARDLALKADVVVQNTRAGVMESLGLDAGALRKEKPGLVHASISGFGSFGPSRKRPGLDIAAQAESGMMSITGERGGSPLKAGFPVADVSTANATASAILAALFRQARTGQGETIETSLLAVAISMQAQIWAEYQCTGKLPVRFGNAQPLVAPAADVIAVQDGHIVISAYMDDHWRRLCKAIGLPALAMDPLYATNNDRVRNRPGLMEVLGRELGRYTGEEARALLERHEVVVGVVRDYTQVLASADVQASGVFQAVGDGHGGELKLPGLPFLLGEALADGPMPVVPRLGEHTAEVLAQAGYSADDISRLQAGGVVGTAPCSLAA